MPGAFNLKMKYKPANNKQAANGYAKTGTVKKPKLPTKLNRTQKPALFVCNALKSKLMEITASNVSSM